MSVSRICPASKRRLATDFTTKEDTDDHIDTDGATGDCHPTIGDRQP